MQPPIWRTRYPVVAVVAPARSHVLTHAALPRLDMRSVIGLKNGSTRGDPGKPGGVPSLCPRNSRWNA